MNGSRALFLLLRLKWRGTWRRQFRRLRTPKGLVLTILGVGLFTLWIGWLVASFLSKDPLAPDSVRLEPRVQAAGIVLVLLSLSSALSHRGLYLVRDEIERLFSAPVTRAELVRYRLYASSLRSLLGSAIVALAAMRRMPIPLFAFAGILLGMQTLPIFHQLVAILLGGLEKRFAEKLRRLGTAVLLALVAAAGLLLFLLFAHRTPEDLPLVGPLLAALAATDGEDPFQNELLHAIGMPLLPWARMITATSIGAFLPWLAVCLGIWLVLFETCARLPLDYRELSLETSASVAARIRRARRGGAAAGHISTRAAGWKVPWFFGRSPAGAVAWRKTASIVRKAKGTFWVSSVVLVFITALSSLVSGRAVGGSEDRLATLFLEAVPLFLIAGAGTLYLCAGLRFDFRDELERMEVIRAWPLAPARLFVAMLAPEVALVSALLIAAVCMRALLSGAIHPFVPLIALLQPLVVFAWVALDNTVFLLAPSRVVPGQEGALANAGRGLVLVLARFLVLGLVVSAGGVAAGITWWITDTLLAWTLPLAIGASFLALWTAIALVDLGLVLAGGEVLRRFDLARDRG